MTGRAHAGAGLHYYLRGDKDTSSLHDVLAPKKHNLNSVMRKLQLRDILLSRSRKPKKQWNNCFRLKETRDMTINAVYGPGLDPLLLKAALGQLEKFNWGLWIRWGFPGGSEVKASASNAGGPGLIPGLGRSPGEGNGNPPQYSCLENPMDGEAW